VGGITDFPFMGCDLAGDIVSPAGEVQNLAARLLRQMRQLVNGFQASLNISHVGFRLSMRKLTHQLPPLHGEFQGAGLTMTAPAEQSF